MCFLEKQSAYTRKDGQILCVWDCHDQAGRTGEPGGQKGLFGQKVENSLDFGRCYKPPKLKENLNRIISDTESYPTNAFFFPFERATQDNSGCFKGFMSLKCYRPLEKQLPTGASL